jgi:hypothetical protein
MIRAKEARLRYLGSCYAHFLFLSLGWMLLTGPASSIITRQSRCAMRDENQLHAAVVELIAHDRARECGPAAGSLSRGLSAAK